GSQLDDSKKPPGQADSSLFIKDRAARCQFDEDRCQQNKWTGCDQQNQGQRHINPCFVGTVAIEVRWLQRLGVGEAARFGHPFLIVFVVSGRGEHWILQSNKGDSLSVLDVKPWKSDSKRQFTRRQKGRGSMVEETRG